MLHYPCCISGVEYYGDVFEGEQIFGDRLQINRWYLDIDKSRPNSLTSDGRGDLASRVPAA